MIFSSFNFWIVFPIIFIIYWLIPSNQNRFRNIFLIIVSYLLYMNWKPSFALVLLGVTIITYIGGLLLNAKRHMNKLIICWCFTLLGLLPLVVFKYYNFINNTILSGLDIMGLHFHLPGLNWAIPIGISFFTFQAVGYLLDVYHCRITAERNLCDYVLYVAFFPQITSGPISTGAELLPQIKSPHFFTYEKCREGLLLLLWGMFLKLVVADRLGIFVDTVYSNYTYYNGLTCFVTSVFYSIQIYADFAGYSLMAIGVAKTLGFDLVNNFNRPYFAPSITEFWKRWHISLTRWLTTHVYINLGGNRCGRLRQYVNIMITFLVSGLWHGANWTFVIWGAIHGLLQIIEKCIGIDMKGKYYSEIDAKLWLKPVRVVITFLLVNFAWIFFRMPTIDSAIEVLTKIITFDQTGSTLLYTKSSVIYACVGFIIMSVKDMMDEYYKIDILNSKFRSIRWFVYIFIFCLIITIGVLDSGNFIYVNF